MPELYVPDWVHPNGLLPRETEYGKCQGVPVFREAVTLIPRGEWPTLLTHPDKPSCTKLIWNTYNQGSVGSCASEACDKGLETIREYAGAERVKFNPYYAYHTVSNGVDGGSSLDFNIVFLKKYGACPESVWPRSKGWRAKPSEEANAAAHKYRLLECFDIDTSSESSFETEIGTALLLGWPVYCGYSGHAILLVELIDVNTARYENSWGDNWGDNGMGTISLSKLLRAYGAFAPRVGTAA